MKTRLITAFILAAGALAVIFTNNIYLYAVVLAAINIMSCFELLKSLNLHKNLFLTTVVMAASTAAPLLMLNAAFRFIFPAFMLYFLLFFFAVVISFTSSDLHGCGILFTMSLIVYICTCSLMRIVVTFPLDSIYYIILVLMCAFMSDSFAYFTGLLCGKHKLLPAVSPNKTIEGSVGGFVGCLLLNAIAAVIYSVFFLKDTGDISYPALLLISAAASVASMLGDLAASAIKRVSGIKDFSNLLPGHGGVLDRIDSMIFAVPTAYAMLTILPVVIR